MILTVESMVPLWLGHLDGRGVETSVPAGAIIGNHSSPLFEGQLSPTAHALPS
jgi:hypothetical protein